MTVEQAIHQFAADAKLRAVLVLIAVDFVVGICAAVKEGEFRLSYITAFLRDDVLGKVIPWAALYVGGKLTDVELPGGIMLSTIANGAYILIIAAIGGSILKSAVELGLFGGKDNIKDNRALEALARPEDQGPPA